MKELDLLLERWLRCEFDQASPLQRRSFAALLELPDPDLAAYLLGHLRPPTPELAAAVDSVLAAGEVMSSSAVPAEPSTIAAEPSTSQPL